MKPTVIPATRVVPFGPGLQAQLRPVAHASSGALNGLDFRLYREVSGTGEFALTSAGFRIPAECLRAVAEHLLEMANELDA